MNDDDLIRAMAEDESGGRATVGVMMVCVVLFVVLVGVAASVFAGLETTRKGYWVVLDDAGGQVSRHAEQDKAFAAAASWAVEHPGREAEVVPPRYVTQYTGPPKEEGGEVIAPALGVGYSVPADAAAGYVSEIAVQALGGGSGGKRLVHAAVALEPGWTGVLHVQDTETWEVVGGTSASAGEGDGLSVRHLMVWLEVEEGRQYRAEVWTTRTLEDGTSEEGERKREAVR